MMVKAVRVMLEPNKLKCFNMQVRQDLLITGL